MEEWCSNSLPLSSQAGYDDRREVVMTIVYFESRAALRKWFATNHGKQRELWIGFYKKHTGKPTVTYPEAVDEALCIGWIDGVRKRVDDERYTNRFTPRKPGSYWSAVNTKRATELKTLGRMKRPGLAAFDARDRAKTRRYSFERETASFSPDHERLFKMNTQAWEFFQRQPPSYRRTLTWWVVSAAKDETRMKRLRKLIEASAAARRVL
jgi:uncharacterized protein YdeI (YjbR/CyaY-like superfamily)